MRRRTARKYIPPQHGAWAMLLVPWLAGVLVAGFRWLHLPLLVAWLAGYARLRRERALVNDLASVVQNCVMVLVAATVTGAEISQATLAFVAVLRYFTGTVLYVKTMIRERDNPAFHRLSVIYHVLAFAGAASLGVTLAVVFAVLLARAAALPRYRLAPKHVGIVEIGTSALVLLAAVTA
ncbi:YwiC-like family protein [Micromonospora inyonensis]|uniref:YwiC-like protein n=1 Tax=Micromonospora inyonensis TaxID=47866 RepID=A0A1C6RDV0_9ACTN|nr:YwiC-like family protein [Micromonospora inyonensis]SCL15329.1 YwiC-like protein [Micromonospora inyonensis]